MKNKFIYVIIFRLILILGFIWYKEYTNIFWKTIYIKTRPVDPRDIFLWDYVNLSYELSSYNCNLVNLDKNLYILLNLDKDNIAYGYWCTNMKPTTWLFILGKQYNNRILFGIEKYFVQEWKWKDMEKYIWNSLVEIKLDNNWNALIKSILQK